MAAGTVDELLVQIGVDAAGLVAGLNAASNAIGQEGSELQKLENLHANLNKRLDLTANAYQRQVQIVEELKRRIAQQGTETQENAESLARLRAELEKAEQKENALAMAMDRTKNSLSQTEAKMRDLANQTKNNAEQAKRLEQENQKLQESYSVLAAVGTAAFMAIVAAIKEGIEQYVAYRNALVGLKSIAEGTGNSFSEVKDQIADFISDGLIPAGDAATAFKNLLARGFNTNEAVAMLKRLKDSASFGRQGTLSLGEAVRAATEGLKNENSILVDNAGVTKNVSKMWEEYAATIGKSVNDLSLAEKRQAEYNGIMQETKFQVGDAAKYSAEFAGTQAMLGAETTKLSQAFGEAMAPAIQGVMEILIAIIKPITDFIKHNQTLVSIMTTIIAVFVAAIAILAGIKVATGLWAKFAVTMGLVPPAAAAASAGITGVGVASGGAAVGVGLLRSALDLLAAHPIVLALTALVAVTMAVIAAVKGHEEAERKALEASKERVTTLSQQRAELAGLAKEYDNLQTKQNKTSEESDRMAQIERDLVQIYGASANAVDSQGNAIARGNAIIEERIRLLREEQMLEQQKIVDANAEAAQGLQDQIANDQKWLQTHKDTIAQYGQDGFEQLKAIYDQYGFLSEEALKQLDTSKMSDYWKSFFEIDENGQITDTVAGLEQQFQTHLGVYENAASEIERLSGVIGESQGQLGTNFQQGVAFIVSTIQAGGQQVSDAATTAAMALAESVANGTLTYEEAMAQAQTMLEQSASLEDFFLSEVERIAGPADELSSTIQDSLNSLAEAIDGGTGTIEEKKAAFTEAVEDFFGDVDLQATFDELETAGANAFDDSITGLMSYETALQNAIVQVDRLTGVSQQMKNALKSQLQKELDNTTKRINNLTDASSKQNKILKQVDQIYGDLADGSKRMKTIDNVVNAFIDLGKQKAAVETLKSATKGTAEFDAALSELSKATGLSEETILSIEDLDTITQGTEADLIALYNQLLALSGVNPSTGNIQGQLMAIAGDANNANSAVAALILQLQSLTNVKIDSTTGRATGVGPVRKRSGGGGGGGGGGSKNSKYNKAIEEMEYKKSMDKLTLEQEIAMLEEIKKKYAKSAEDKKDIELRLYEARKALQEKQLNDQLDNLDHDVAMGKVSKEEELKRLRDIYTNFAKTEEQKRELLERMHDLEIEIQEDRYNAQIDALDHEKAMGRLSLDEEKKRLEEMLKDATLTAEQRAELEERLYALIEEIHDKEYDDARRLMDYKVRMGQMTLEQQLAQMKKLLETAELDAEERMDLEMEIYDLEVELQEKRYQSRLEEINDLKDFDKLRLEDEIAMLENILLTEELTAEQRKEIEKQIYDARKALLAEQAAEVDQLAEALTKALQEKYKTQQKAEQAAIKDSIDNWKEWEKTTVKAIKDAANERIKAINEEIDALDRMLKQEEEADIDAEERRKIAALQQQIAFEYDAENKNQLQKELAKLEQDRADRLRKLDIEAQKDALKEQIDMVKEQAEADEEATKEKSAAEQEALQQRLDELNKFYEEQLNALKIQGEVEQLIIAQNQEDILALLKEYNPEYNATGQSLGQRFVEGFGDAMAPLLAMIEDINTQFDAAQRQIIGTTIQPSNGFTQALIAANKAMVIDFQKVLESKRTPTNIELKREYNFYKQVDSPYEMRRAVEKTDQDLVELFGGLG